MPQSDPSKFGKGKGIERKKGEGELLTVKHSTELGFLGQTVEFTIYGFLQAIFPGPTERISDT